MEHQQNLYATDLLVLTKRNFEVFQMLQTKDIIQIHIMLMLEKKLMHSIN